MMKLAFALLLMVVCCQVLHAETDNEIRRLHTGKNMKEIKKRGTKSTVDDEDCDDEGDGSWGNCGQHGGSCNGDPHNGGSNGDLHNGGNNGRPDNGGNNDGQDEGGSNGGSHGGGGGNGDNGIVGNLLGCNNNGGLLGALGPGLGGLLKRILCLVANIVDGLLDTLLGRLNL